MTTPEQVTGEINGIRYYVDQSVIDQLKQRHGIDAIKEIENALKKENNENSSTEGQSPGN